MKLEWDVDKWLQDNAADFVAQREKREALERQSARDEWEFRHGRDKLTGTMSKVLQKQLKDLAQTRRVYSEENVLSFVNEVLLKDDPHAGFHPRVSKNEWNEKLQCNITIVECVGDIFVIVYWKQDGFITDVHFN